MLTQAAEKVFLAREMAKSGGSEMYPQGSAIAYSASNRVDDFAFGIDRDFFPQPVTACGTQVPLRNRRGSEGCEILWLSGPDGGAYRQHRQNRV
jgi:hypothetical protein